jgi:ATP-dependent DNA helicase RecG
MRKLMLYGKKYGGVDPQLIEGDIFRMVVSVPEFQENEISGDANNTSPVTGEVAGEVTGEVKALLKALDAPMIRKALQEKLKLQSQANFRDRYLIPALTLKVIEMTQPDAPKSPTQKYRLTDKGRAVLKEISK